MAFEGRFEDQVGVCQELKPLGRAQKRMTGCAVKWQQGKARWAVGTGRMLGWPGGGKLESVVDEVDKALLLQDKSFDVIM